MAANATMQGVRRPSVTNMIGMMIPSSKILQTLSAEFHTQRWYFVPAHIIILVVGNDTWLCNPSETVTCPRTLQYHPIISLLRIV
jgi:hypothetical protein